jgi:hypothetical protein
MSDEYLWDGSGRPDPDVQKLETLLGRLHAPPAGAPRLPARPLQWRTLRYLGPALGAAAAVLALIGVALQTRTAVGSWTVASLAGRPRIESSMLAGTGRIAVGQTLVTDGASQARLTVATIGEVTVDTNSRVRLEATRDGHHRLALDRGTLHAFINAPPGQFVVSTPSATATDLGCAYTLHVDEDGAGYLSVTSGWVALAAQNRESLVPVGASSRLDTRRGPGTPSYDDADQELKVALDVFDRADDAAERSKALPTILEHAGPGDAMTLWHLISRVDPSDRPAVVDALTDFLAMPDGVTREAVLALDPAALDRWWNALGLGDADWWRQLKLVSW